MQEIRESEYYGAPASVVQLKGRFGAVVRPVTCGTRKQIDVQIKIR